MYKGTHVIIVIILYVQAMETRKAAGQVQGEGGEDTEAWLGQIEGGKHVFVHVSPNAK